MILMTIDVLNCFKTVHVGLIGQVGVVDHADTNPWLFIIRAYDMLAYLKSI